MIEIPWCISYIQGMEKVNASLIYLGTYLDRFQKSRIEHFFLTPFFFFFFGGGGDKVYARCISFPLIISLIQVPLDFFKLKGKKKSQGQSNLLATNFSWATIFKPPPPRLLCLEPDYDKLARHNLNGRQVNLIYSENCTAMSTVDRGKGRMTCCCPFRNFIIVKVSQKKSWVYQKFSSPKLKYDSFPSILWYIPL